MQVSTYGQDIDEKSSHLDGTSFKRMHLSISGLIIIEDSSNLD